MRIGLYSGSFNPVHVGHVALCDFLVREKVVDQVWLVRSPLNPFKANTAQTLAPDADRAAMLRIAIRGHRGLRVSTVEDDLPKPNYTITTLTVLQQQYPVHEFHLIIGADNWLAFDRWGAHDELLTRFHLIVYPRPGYPLGDAERLRLGVEAISNVRFVDAPLYDVSSTEIRDSIRQGQCPPMLNPRVFAYIQQHQLYL